jgi:hypothetical protein
VEVRSTNSHRWLNHICIQLHDTGQTGVCSMELCFNVNICSIFLRVFLISGSFNKAVIRKAVQATQFNDWKSEHLKRRLLLIHSLPGASVIGTYVVLLQQNDMLFSKAMIAFKRRSTWNVTVSLFSYTFWESPLFYYWTKKLTFSEWMCTDIRRHGLRKY